MSAGLFGSLYSSVSGMEAASTSIAMTADNIANVNTVGYKTSRASFSTLVTTMGSSGSYSSGGVLASAVQQIDQQGTQMNTGRPMDIAITRGTGMIPVNGQPDGTGEFLYTRKGDFAPDQTGTYRNDGGTGFTLLGWTLDSNGRLPGEFGNLDTTPNSLLSSLVPVNLKTVNGSASATTEVKISGNLKESQSITNGVETIIKLPTSSVVNNINGVGLSATDVIIPEVSGNYAMVEGDVFSLTPSSTGVTNQFIYGGITASNDISAGIYGVNGPDLSFLAPAGDGQNFTIATPSAGTLTFKFKTGAVNPAAGEFNSLTTLANAINQIDAPATVNGQLLTARIYNNRLYVAPINASESMTITDVLGSLAATIGLGSTSAGSNRFATLEGLATLINNTGGLKAIVDSPTRDSQIEVYATDPLGTLAIDATKKSYIYNNLPFQTTGVIGSTTIVVNDTGHGLAIGDYVNLTNTGVASNIDGITFGDGTYQVTGVLNANQYTVSGTGGSAATASVITGGTSGVLVTDALGPNPFTTGAAGTTLVTVTQPHHGYADGDRVKFTGVTNPINGVTITDGQAYTISYIDASHYSINATSGTSTGAGAGGGSTITVNPFSEILRQLGLPVNDVALGPKYDPTAATAENMAGGLLQTDYSVNTRVYDSFGSGHDIMIGYLKTGINTWSVEIWATNPSEIISPTNRTDGQLAYGMVTFNGDGTLKSVSSTLSTPLTITWSDASLPSAITFNWGTAGAVKGTPGATVIGLNDGLGQVDGEFSRKFIEQNGYAPSELTSVTIDPNGYVVASFSTGETQKIFKIPLVEFTNVNGLEARTGNAYAETYASGTYNLRQADQSTIGQFNAGHLEQADVEISEQLTDMLVAQKGYQASARVIKTVNELLDELLRALG
jgi:flagellar hook protein FlgE